MEHQVEFKIEKIWNADEFIRESNKIDVQYIENTREIIPGEKPGDLLYDNHLAALAFMMQEHGRYVTISFVLDVHRLLTRGIPFFEDRGMSGRIRTTSCEIRNSDRSIVISTPEPYMLRSLLQAWCRHLDGLISDVRQGKKGVQDLWDAHYCFEVIHPFIDGNGRSGRLLLAWSFWECGLEPPTVRYDERFDYFDRINHYRAHEYPKFFNQCVEDIQGHS